MRLILESKDNINVTKLPNNIDGNFWIENGIKNLVNVEAVDNKWILKSDVEVKISSSFVNDKLSNVNYLDNIVLEENSHYFLFDTIEGTSYILYVLPSYENMDNFIVDYNQVGSIIIGRKNVDLMLNNEFFFDKELSIEFDKKINAIVMKNLGNNKVFVNNKLCINSILVPGDIIFDSGVYFYYFGSLLLVSNSKGDLSFNSLKLNKRLINTNETRDYSSFIDKDVKLYDKNMYYQRPPRFKRKIETKMFEIDAPTQKENQQEMPLIFTIAPMLTMGMMSLVSGLTALQRVLEGKSTIKDEFTSLLTCVCMLCAMILFPLAQKFYTKIKKKQKERKRRRKYKKYIDKKREEIFAEINFQKQVLIEDNLPVEKVRDIVLTRSRNLWERKLEHDDFLELRLGIGTKKPDIDIKYPEEHFTLEEDDLKDIIYDLVNESKDIVDVPITLNLKEFNKVGLIGERSVVNSYLYTLMLQIMAYHGYDMLRLIILTNDSNKVYWDKYRNLTYLWNNSKTLRYYATNKEDINKVMSYLREEYNYRLETAKDSGGIFSPYYLIITDDVNLVKNNIFIKDLLKLQFNLGYSLLMCVDKLDVLPNECSMFINIGRDSGGLFTNQMTEDNQSMFVPDFVNFSLRNVITNISNIPMDINSGKFVLPQKYGFLEMYDVGSVSQLNLLNRWKNNDIIKSLSCPVGIDEQGELFNLDLHEKAHGPHGLVAGMTGSGKSEWIITYILSMAVNYSPEEVQFVLIDYKGGGLALTFDNRENDIKLPHVVGTLTNLDVVEMKRSLASINSELKRRQNMFKSAREQLNESSMDIYKYQELYRAGKLSEPMSHLFIISDEFAELKSQQPDFMDELISTARIGRSLGVHLILATQKPSGVVDAQIWSNSKFKVCLKVQDKTDSNDMLKCPDAAMLKETGRFYLQVGFNEFFAKGQSAYAGVPYYESDKKITIVDSTVDFVDNIGSYIKRGDIEKNNTQYVHKGEELPNILNYIIETAKNSDLKINPLWLSSIPGVIYVDKLKTKYNYEKKDYFLDAVIGEYDQPSKQQQGILTLPISKDGNVLLYGTSGSGKELFLTTLIYSLITTYRPDEVGLYILDFGTEVLNNFVDCSHVGDIVHSGEDEKIGNLFKYIRTEIDFRRKKFLSYNGNYQDFVEKSDIKVPNIVVVINSFDVFSELYPDYAENLYEITRECNKFGIHFVLSVNSINGVKSKLLQSFKSIFTLQLNNEFDYKSIFPTSTIIPSKLHGRGLFKKDMVLEFQTAYAFPKEELYNKILETSIKSFMQYKTKMKPIPVLPETIEFAHISKGNIDFDFLPVGMIKKDLGIATIKLNDILSYLISFRNFDENIPFIDKFLHILDNSSINTFVFDSKYIYENNDFKKINYLNTEYSKVIDKLSSFVNQIEDMLKKNNNNIRAIKDVQKILCVVIGVDKFINSLSSEDKEKFINLLTKSKDSLKIHFIFIDIPSGFKPYEFEMWYKNCINPSCGLWVGDGFGEQFLIKPTKVIQSYYDVIGNNFGYIVDNGQVDFIKVIEKMK